MSALRASAVSEPRPLSPVAPPVEATVLASPGGPISVPSASTEPNQHSEQMGESHPAATGNGNVTQSNATGLESQETKQVELYSVPLAQAEAPFFADDLVAAETPGFDHNLMVAAPDPPIPANLKDPELIGPAVVKVVPEPLLENDEPASSNDYNSHPEETAPMHSLDYPAAPFSAHGSSGDGENVEAKAATGESVSEVASPSAESFAPMAEPEQAPAPPTFAEEHSVAWTERTPTVPPPNRESLADIPFLTPPSVFQSQAPETGVDSATVDAVVRKVLERLESQIHGILSQGALKPLVENLLENELSKKEK